MYLYINNNKLKITLEDNISTKALIDILKQNDISFSVNDYGGFEKVGALGFSLPRNDQYIDSVSGDVLLYLGNQMSINYGSNSWSYTRIGRIEGFISSELKLQLGASLGVLSVRLSLN